jgi:hypothetical protein
MNAGIKGSRDRGIKASRDRGIEGSGDRGIETLVRLIEMEMDER